MAYEPTDIEFSDLVGESTLSSGGYIGQLMDLAHAHIAKAKNSGSITQKEAGTMYSAMLNSSFQTGLEFLLNKDQAEAATDKVLADTELAAARLDIDNNMAEAELEKQWGYDVTRDPETDELILGASSDEGKIDAETDKIEADVLIAQEEIEIAKAKAANEQAQTIANIEKVYGYDCDIDGDGNISVGNDTMDGKLDFDNKLIVEKTETENKQNEEDGVIDKQILDIVAGTTLKGSQDAEVIAGTTRADSESLSNIGLVAEKTLSESKQNETDGVIDKQILDIVAGTTLKGSQDAEVLAGTTRSDADGEVTVTLKESQNLEVLAGTIRSDLTSSANDALVAEKTDSEAKQNETGGVIDKQILDIVAGTTLKGSQDAEVLAGTVRSDADGEATVALKESQNTEVLAGTTRSDIESSANVSLTAEKTQSEAKQNEDNGVIDKQVLDIVAGTTLKDSQNLEVLAGTTRNDADGEATVALKGSQNSEVIAGTTRSNADGAATVTLKGSQNSEVLAGTTRSDTESTANVALTAEQTEKLVNDTNLSLLNAQLGAWTSSYTSGKLDNRPDLLDNEEIECLYDKILGDVADDTCKDPGE